MYKNIYIITFLFLFTTINIFGQSKKELIEKVRVRDQEIKELKANYEQLQGQFLDLQIRRYNEIKSIKNELLKLTLSLDEGAQISEVQSVKSNSLSETQINSLNTPTSKSTITKSSSSSTKSSNYGYTPSTGAKIHTGPRGGRYYINSRGNKVYVK